MALGSLLSSDYKRKRKNQRSISSLHTFSDSSGTSVTTSSGCSLQSTLIRPAPLTDCSPSLFHSQLMISDFRPTIDQRPTKPASNVVAAQRAVVKPSANEHIITTHIQNYGGVVHQTQKMPKKTASSAHNAVPTRSNRHGLSQKMNQRNNTAPQVVTDGNSSEIVDIETLENLRCEWKGCKRKFTSQKALVDHVFSAHIQWTKQVACLALYLVHLSNSITEHNVSICGIGEATKAARTASEGMGHIEQTVLY
ncbi:unnamed protein product [Gongylonema pulchrum]|uniref:C2H2-type domain-containing protein n=1 Tax=Gongylonema pulchrum TaxID=637853 RepID=A0A3P6P4K3_9BILA|nr:unnamed protein product [Gongylonema pulchrum]